MVTLHIADKEIECAEVRPIKLTMLITESGQEYLLINDWGRQHLYAVRRGEKERPEFAYIDQVVRVEEEPRFRRIAQ
ncbi:hypothetical protein SRRS_42110 [Sporomusa rhizae]|uniref:hypothetical protein n=1 Tax=Sporomusa rhizae TaxID=357999 RepID=UPI00352A5530